MMRQVPQAGIEPATDRLEASRVTLGTNRRQYLPPHFSKPTAWPAVGSCIDFTSLVVGIGNRRRRHWQQDPMR